MSKSQCDICMSLEFGKEVRAKNVNLGFIRIEIVFMLVYFY